MDLMENHNENINYVLCDELISEILSKIQGAADRKNSTLVCRKWLYLEGRIKARLSICLPMHASTYLPSIQSLLSRYSHLISLTMVTEGDHQTPETLDPILIAISKCCPLLQNVRFASGPVSKVGLRALSRGCTNLYSMELVTLASQNFPALCEFPALRELTLSACLWGEQSDLEGVPDGELQLEKLCLEGITARNTGLGWLWRSCPRLKRLEFFGCQGIGDVDPSSLAWCLPTLQELRLRRCRCIATTVLLMASEICQALKVLIFMDGGDMNGLHRVVRSCSSLEVLELRLPLDLFNEDLAVIAQSCNSLKALRLYSCWMATGAGFKLLGTQMKCCLEELVLIRCRAIVQDVGTLAYLGHDLKSLKRLDVSENDHLADREIIGLLACSCERLVHLRLRRCRKLTDRTMEYIAKKCSVLANLVITSCDGISSAGVEALLGGCPALKRIWVEKEKISIEASRMACRRRILLPGVEPNPSDY